MIRRRLFLLLVSCAACLPALLDAPGIDSGDAARTLAGSLLCVASVCETEPPSVDAGTKNLLPNPGFESALEGWRPSNDVSLLSLRRGFSASGSNSARISVLPYTGVQFVDSVGPSGPCRRRAALLRRGLRELRLR